MAEISDYSTTAGSNNSASPAGWPEGMAPSGVNDSDREFAARIKRWYDDISAAVTTGGSANAQTLAASRTISAYAAGQTFSFVAGFTNTATCTLNVDSVGAKTVKKHYNEILAAGDIQAGQIHTVFYDVANDCFQLVTQTPDGYAFVTNTGGGATYDFTLDTTNYDEFTLVLTNLAPANDGDEFWLRTGTAGVFNTANYTWTRTTTTTAGSGADAGSTSDAKVVLLNSTDSAGANVCGRIHIRSQSVMGVRVEWLLSALTDAGVLYESHGCGHYATTADTQIRLLFSTGNITSGTARLYGVRK